VDTLGHLLALRVTTATEQDRAQVEALPKTVVGLQFVAFVCLFLRWAVTVLGLSP
jgi:hypothetical protein